MGAKPLEGIRTLAIVSVKVLGLCRPWCVPKVATKGEDWGKPL
jgi:hypothetical protein